MMLGRHVHLPRQIDPKIFVLEFLSIVALILFVATAAAFLFFYSNSNDNINQLNLANKKLQVEYEALKAEDQYQINQQLQDRINNIETTYREATDVLENLIDLRDQKQDTDEYEEMLALSLKFLSDKNYSSASAVLRDINEKVKKDIAENAAKTAAKSAVGDISNIAVNNTAPGSGFSRQRVKTDFGEYLVDVVAADLNSTRVIVDTASDSDCSDNCPVLSLGDYVGRNGAFAGINGSYFCPASYPSCAGKTNSFDTLLMNKNKTYFNSDNNVYSTVPAVIFSGNSARYVGRSLEWGRDTGVDAVIANQPLLVSGGNVVFGGDDEVKRATAGSRSFIGSTGSTVYIGVVHGVNAAQMARVLQTMGIQNALNLDSGGSTALWSGGYRVGPGRNIPNAILLVRK